MIRLDRCSKRTVVGEKVGRVQGCKQLTFAIAEELLELDNTKTFGEARERLSLENPREEKRFQLLFSEGAVRRLNRSLKMKLSPRTRILFQSMLKDHRETVAECQKALADPDWPGPEERAMLEYLRGLTPSPPWGVFDPWRTAGAFRLRTLRS